MANTLVCHSGLQTSFSRCLVWPRQPACHQQVWSPSPPPSPAAAANDVVKIALRYRSLHQCTPSAACIAMSHSRVFSAAERISFTSAWVNERNLTSHSKGHFGDSFFVSMATDCTGSDNQTINTNFRFFFCEISKKCALTIALSCGTQYSTEELC